MSGFALFTDVSFSPKLKFGLGAYLIVPESYLSILPEVVDKSRVSDQLVFLEFKETSSTRLEVQTVLGALESGLDQFKDNETFRLRIYSDSECVRGLLGRRRRLEANNFMSSKTNKPLKNASLYRRFYALYDAVPFEVIKVMGHQRSSAHDTVHRIFSLVDRAVRRALKLKVAQR